jgi:sulfhydrogenase subunit gamma (sulfur reductase)
MMDNPYIPDLATINEIIVETPTIKTLRVTLNDRARMDAFRFEPGQVGQLSVFGVGEATFVINSPPTRRDYLQFSVMKAGEVTTAIHELAKGDQIGVRAPLGNYFPYESMKGKKILFVGGGIGLAPLRPLILFMLDNRADYGPITIIYGAWNSSSPSMPALRARPSGRASCPRSSMKWRPSRMAPLPSPAAPPS